MWAVVDISLSISHEKSKPGSSVLNEATIGGVLLARSPKICGAIDDKKKSVVK